MDIKTVSGIDTMDTMAVEVEVENIQTGQISRLRDRHEYPRPEHDVTSGLRAGN